MSSLSEGIIFGHKFASIGFRKSKVFEKLSSSGEIRIKTSFKTKEDIESPQLIQLYSDEIEPGMSGAPVLDLETNKVVGLVSEHWITTGNVDTRLNFAIPLESITEVCPILKEKNSGLEKINTFMEAIGKRGSLLYDRFEDLYVLPIEYNELEERLKESRCVFITGTAEYGKTYTAIKLLWEYYKSGYKPKYIEEESSEGARDILKKLVNLDKKSLENSIIYFEDPLGKTKYERNKEFEESIGSIISSLGRLDMYLIVTMREEIYKDFDPIGKKRIGEYVNKLNIGKRSYNYEKRKEMLLRWVSLMECNWVKIEELKNKVLESIKNEVKLPTPLNIKDFASETADIITRDILEKKLDEISQRTPERFAKDIIEMEKRGSQ